MSSTNNAKGIFQKKRKTLNLAVKNPKGESSILGESEFFKTDTGLVIALAFGRTYRRSHQGSNGWNLYVVQGDLPGRPERVKKESWLNFGTYDGAEKNIRWLYPSDLIPISKMEWEKISQREFVVEHEFSWFKGHVERCVLDPELRQGSTTAKTKKSAEMAGYRYFMPVNGLLISVEDGEIRSGSKNQFFPKGKAEMDFIEKDDRFEKIYHYSSCCSYFSRKPFKIKDYHLGLDDDLYVNTSDAEVCFILKGSVPQGTEVTQPLIYVSNSGWVKIKKLHPYWAQLGDDNHQSSGFLLGDLASLQALKEKLA